MKGHYFKGTEQDSKMRKVMDFFSEHLCGEIRPERLIEKKKFTNTNEINSRINRLKIDLQGKQEKLDFMFYTESKEKRNDAFVNTAKHIGIFSFVAPLAGSLSTQVNDLQTTASFAIGISLACVAVQAVKTAGYAIYNKYEQKVAENRSGIKKRDLEKELKGIKKERYELSKISYKMSVNSNSNSTPRFDTDKTLQERMERVNNPKKAPNANFKKLLKKRMELRKNRTTAHGRLPN